jgi:uncharacterized protein
MLKVNRIKPTTLDERILSLDVLRGFAVLGILIMNIQSYSMIDAAYLNPTAYGNLSGINKWVWILSDLLANLKFMAIFSILFGAGVLLFTNRMEAKGISPLKIHYRRTFWLLIIGFAHAYLFWYGDILVNYAICGALVVSVRKWRPGYLVLLGLIMLAIPSLLYLFFGLSWDFMPVESQEGIKISWLSTPELTQKMLSDYRGDWLQQMNQRIPAAISFQTFVFLIFTGWRAGGLMLLGMALYKWDILTLKRSLVFCLVGFAGGFFIGVPLVVYGIAKNFALEWAVDYSMFLGMQYNYWGSLFISFSYISLVLLITSWLKNSVIIKALAAVGRMALSNYLLQTVICTFIFYGHGLGLYGSVERWIQILIVVAIWLLQLIISPLWLQNFRFGPFEWLWRSLTYWKIQPMRQAR